MDIQKQPHLIKVLDFVQQKQNICNHRTRAYGYATDTGAFDGFLQETSEGLFKFL